MAQHPPTDEDLRDVPMAQLLKRLGQDVGTLVHQEAELAKAELGQKVKAAGVSGSMFLGAYTIGMLAAGALTACLILALALVIDAWAAALLVTVVYAVIASALALRGRDRLREAAPAVPEQTMETLKEDIRWAKNPTGSETR